MNVRELIEKLREMNQELGVITSAVEEGGNDIELVEEVDVYNDKTYGIWCGQYSAPDKEHPANCKVVIIG